VLAAYNLGSFTRTLALPKATEPRSLTSPRKKLIKIDAKLVRHGRYVTFQLVEVAVPRQIVRRHRVADRSVAGTVRARTSSVAIVRKAAIGEVCAGVPKSALCSALVRPIGGFEPALFAGARMAIAQGEQKRDFGPKPLDPANVGSLTISMSFGIRHHKG
jgi:hypothetical protein